MPKKGQQIRFIAGKYAGKCGWVNSSVSANRDDTIPVIVDLGGKKGEKSTYVYTDSVQVEDAYSKPSSFAEAVIHQCPDLEVQLVNVCRGFAKCDIERDPVGFSAVMESYLTTAAAWQASKTGKKALYRKIAWKGA